MPIAVKAVAEAEFRSWVEEAKTKYAQADDGAAARQVQVAGAAAR